MIQQSTSTRLHSSRMRTARALTVSPSMFCAGGGVPGPGGVPGLREGGVAGPGGCSWSWGCTWSWGCLLRGVYLVTGGCLLQEGCLLRGGAPGQVLPSPSPVDRHTPVNILPCPKLRLRAVINYFGVCSSFLWNKHNNGLTFSD